MPEPMPLNHGTTLATEHLQALSGTLQGQLLLPSDDGYEAARRLWNGMIDRRPSVVVRCAGQADVVAAVNFARERGLLVAVRGGGHNAAGNAVCDGGLVIDLSAMRQVTVDPARRTARAEGGATWADVDRATQDYGLAVTGGGVSSTGIAGLTLGGGLGWLMRSYGLTCDNLLSAEVVTADGQVLSASATEHPDLFWGLRGGGGNFGVVTAFEYHLHPVQLVLGGMLGFPAERAKDVLRAYREVTQAAPDALTIFAGLMTTPEGIRVLGLLVCFNGPSEEGEALLRPLRELGPVMEQLGPMPYAALQSLQDAIFPHGLHVYWRSHFLARLTDGAIDTLCDQFGDVTSPLSMMLIEHLGGAVRRVGRDETAFAHRDADYNLAIIGRWGDPTEAETHIAWTRRCHEALHPYASGVYVNYLGEEGGERVKAAYSPEQYRRLVALKNRYDPTNFFRLNQNIAPDGPAPDQTPPSGHGRASTASQASSDRESTLRTELDATRTAFHALLAEVGDKHWHERSVDSRWRLGEILSHITAYLDVVVPMALENARQGKSMPNLPGFLMNQMNYLMGKRAARGQTNQSLARQYDAAHARALELLTGVRDAEWRLVTGLPVGQLTIEQVFQHHTAHFRHHAAEIQASLGLAIANVRQTA